MERKKRKPHSRRYLGICPVDAVHAERVRPNIRYAVGDVRPPGFARIFVYAAIHCTQKAVGCARPNTIAWLCGLAGVTKSALPGSVPTSVRETLKMLHEIKTQTPEFGVQAVLVKPGLAQVMKQCMVAVPAG